MNKESVFFAYENGHQNTKDSINSAIIEYNKHQNKYHAKTWEELNISGNILNATILKAIDDCSVFAADLTYQNNNVFFELGYAVGKQKKILLFLNTDVQKAAQRHRDSRIMQGIGYQQFSSGKDIQRALQQHKFEESVSITSLITALINPRKNQQDTKDMVYLESHLQTQASLDLKHALRKIEDQIIINDSVEIDYQPLTWYIDSIVRSKLVIIHLADAETHGHELHNGEYSFFAGLAKGLGKRVAILAPEQFNTPIDYNDILIKYKSNTDCINKVQKWYYDNKTSNQTELPNKNDSSQISPDFDTLRLEIGYESAEEELQNLHHYFIELEALRSAISRGSTIITGRKGAGKTALFFKLRNDFKSVKHNGFTVVLQPESEELFANVILSDLYKTASSKQTFLTTIWRFVIFSQLLESVNNKIFEKYSHYDETEQKIIDFVEKNSDTLKMGHFAFLKKIYSDLDQAKGFGKPNTLETIYNKYISPIRDLLRKYFSGRRFVEINILADNLDKTWDSKNDLDLQANMILQLLSFNDKVSSELSIIDSKTNTTVFLRNDIFEYILKQAREPDKLVAKKNEIDWNNFPERLRDLLEVRFRYSLNRDNNESIDDIWKKYFIFSGRQHPFDKIASVVLSRPRDYIFFIRRLFESSVNRSLENVSDKDFDYAVKQYDLYLYQNMIAETRAIFPQITSILARVKKETNSGTLKDKNFIRLIKDEGIKGNNINEFIKFLFENDYIYCFERRTDKVIKDFDIFLRKLNEKRLGIFRKHPMIFQVIPNRSRLKS